MEKINFKNNCYKSSLLQQKNAIKNNNNNNNAVYQCNKQNNFYIDPLAMQNMYNVSNAGYVKLAVKKLPSGENMHIYQLKNGQKVGLIKGGGSTKIDTFIDVGSLDEPNGKEGISHLIEHSMFHGSKKYPNLETEFSNIGANRNGATTFDYTSYQLSLPTNNKEEVAKAIDIFADMIYNPTFSKLKKEKAIVTSEALRSQSSESGVIFIQQVKDILSVNKNLKDVTTGSPESIAKITEQDMFKYYNEYYTPNNIVSVIHSNIEPDELIKIAAQKFNNASEGRLCKNKRIKIFNPVSNNIRRDYISKQENSGGVYLNFCVPSSKNQKETAKIQALLELITSRTPFSDNSTGNVTDNLAISTLYAPDMYNNENELFSILAQKLKEVLINPPNDFEINKIKNNLLSNIDELYKSSEDTVHEAGYNLLKQNYQEFETRKEIIKNLTKEDIIDALKYFDMNKCQMTVIHPKGTSQDKIKESYAKSINSIEPISLPMLKSNINILPSLKAHNIEPYTNNTLYETVLPDNTRFIAINSDTDTCQALWKLENPDLSSHNIAAKYFLVEMANFLNSEQEYLKAKKNIEVSPSYSSTDGLSVSVKCKAEDIEDALEIAKKSFDMMFSTDTFEHTKNIILDKINLKSPSDSYNAFISDRFGKNYCYNQEKIKQELENLTIEDVKKYFNDMLLNSYSTFCLIGPIKQDPLLLNKAASTINVPFFSFKKESIKDVKASTSKDATGNFYFKDTNNSKLTLANAYQYKTDGNVKDSIKFSLLTLILSKRLFDDLREKQGLAYYVSAYQDNIYDNSLINLELELNSDKKEDIENVYKGFNEHVQKLKLQPPSKEELEEAKNKYKQKIYDFFESDNAPVATINRACSPCGLKIFENNLEFLNTITPDDIKNAANYAFKDEPDYLFDGNKNIFNSNKDYFSSLIKGKIIEE